MTVTCHQKQSCLATNGLVLVPGYLNWAALHYFVMDCSRLLKSIQRFVCSSSACQCSWRIKSGVRPSGLARSHPHHSGDGTEHRNASRPEPTRRHRNNNFGLHRRKAHEEQERLSTNVLSPHIRALHQEINNNGRSPPPSHEYLIRSSPTAQAQQAAVAVVGRYQQLSGFCMCCVSHAPPVPGALSLSTFVIVPRVV